MKSLLIKPVVAVALFSSQTIHHPAKDFLPVFDYPSEAIENAIPRQSKVIEYLSSSGTQEFVIQSTVDLKTTPQWKQRECRWEGSPPYERRICEDITYYGLDKKTFKEGHVKSIQASLKVEDDRRTLTFETLEYGVPVKFPLQVLDILPGNIGRASIELFSIDRNYERFRLHYSIQSENPKAVIRLMTYADPRPYVWSTTVRFEKVNGEIPRIPAVFDTIETNEAFEFFERQSKSDDWEYVERFLSLNWAKIRHDRDNVYVRYIYNNLRSPPSFHAGLNSRLEYVKRIPSGDPLIVEQTNDPYTIVERNYQFLVYGHDQLKTYSLLKDLIRKGAKVIRKDSLSDLRTDILYYDLRRVTDPELREMLFKAAKDEGVVPVPKK